jgi:3-deoxy-7-phosphoheptulonate synthase
MIIITRPASATPSSTTSASAIEGLGMRTHISRGETRVIVGCIGDEEALRGIPLLRLPGVESVTPVTKPYKLASRDFAADRTVVRIGDAAGTVIGGPEITVIAGPCSVEGAGDAAGDGPRVKAAGARLLRGGAFKPRSSPTRSGAWGGGAAAAGGGAGGDGAPGRHGGHGHAPGGEVAEHADVLQVGARNMQNFALLDELGRIRRPVLLKRGLSATVEELLMAAEYIMSQGNRDVILCERGIRTFETATRNTLDVGAIPVLRRETHLPVIVDPSHAAGRADLVAPLAFAAIAAGADGLMVEVHPDPERRSPTATSRWSSTPSTTLMDGVRPSPGAAGRSFAGARGAVADYPYAVRPHERPAPVSCRREPDRRAGRGDRGAGRRAGRLARRIGEVKRESGGATLDPGREAAVVRQRGGARPGARDPRGAGAGDLLDPHGALPRRRSWRTGEIGGIIGLGLIGGSLARDPRPPAGASRAPTGTPTPSGPPWRPGSWPRAWTRARRSRRCWWSPSPSGPPWPVRCWRRLPGVAGGVTDVGSTKRSIGEAAGRRAGGPVRRLAPHGRRPPRAAGPPPGPGCSGAHRLALPRPRGGAAPGGAPWRRSGP